MRMRYPLRKKEQTAFLHRVCLQFRRVYRKKERLVAMFDLIKEDLQTIYEKDSSAESRLEVALCYPGFHALQFHRAAHWCHIQGWTTVARVVSSLGRFFTGVEIHPAAKIGRRVFIDHGMGVVIGNTVEIGDDCTIYQGATIGGTDIGKENAKLTIKNNVVVGAGAQILGGVTVGENAQIGPSAVVLKSVGAHVAVGLPQHIAKNVKGLSFSAEEARKLEALVETQAEEIRQLRAELGSSKKAGEVEKKPTVKKAKQTTKTKNAVQSKSDSGAKNKKTASSRKTAASSSKRAVSARKAAGKKTPSDATVKKTPIRKIASKAKASETAISSKKKQNR